MAAARDHRGARCVPEISCFLVKNKSGLPRCKPDIEKWKHNTGCSPAVCYLSLLLNFALIVGLIIVSIYLPRCNPDTEERKHDTGSSTIVPCTNALTETKNECGAPCEEDWIWYRGKCYYFSKDSNTWEKSQNFCISHNASLALINTQDELDVLLQFKGLYNHWIGLRRTDDNKAWTWTNGTLYSESLFKIIRSSQKNIEYVYLNHEAVKSQEGTIPFKWICKKT